MKSGQVGAKTKGIGFLLSVGWSLQNKELELSTSGFLRRAWRLVPPASGCFKKSMKLVLHGMFIRFL